VTVPGAKSATARSLILSALASGPGTVAGGLVARDTSLMIAALRALGAAVDDAGPVWTVTPPAAVTGGGDIDCGLAGTVLRFVPPVAALALDPTSFRGDPAAADRPIAPLLDGLSQLGARVDGRGLPFAVRGPVTGRVATIDASASSQFVSGLLLSAPRLPLGLELRHAPRQAPAAAVTAPIPSYPHIQMTIAALEARGVTVEALLPRTPRHGPAAPAQPTSWRVAPAPVAPLDEVIEPDLTTAAVFLAAALVAGGAVRVAGWPRTTTQPGAATPDLLTAFGGSAAWTAAGLTVTGDGGLTGQDLDLGATSELTPVIAALAALAETPTTICGVAHIRGHETNRLAALAAEINGLGGRARETADGLAIEPAPLRGGTWHTYGDHRLAHAGALIGLRVPGVTLDDVAVVAKTMPGFAAVWEAIV
jgi:3-phosphoshikimate 1-carboxyvinyltransferase